MSIKSVLENSFVTKLAYAIAASTIIGGGTVVLHNQSQIAVMESQRGTTDQRLERIENKIDALSQEILFGRPERK